MQIYNQSAKNCRTRGTITPKARKTFKELFSSGFTQTEIAKEYNVPVGTVGSIVKPRVKSHYNPKKKNLFEDFDFDKEMKRLRKKQQDTITLMDKAVDLKLPITAERKPVEETAITKLIMKREQLLTEVAAINQAIEILKGL